VNSHVTRRLALRHSTRTRHAAVSAGHVPCATRCTRDRVGQWSYRAGPCHCDGHSRRCCMRRSRLWRRRRQQNNVHQVRRQTCKTLVELLAIEVACARSVLPRLPHAMVHMAYIASSHLAGLVESRISLHSTTARTMGCFGCQLANSVPT
jgi:hypothetical protein